MVEQWKRTRVVEIETGINMGVTVDLWKSPEGAKRFAFNFSPRAWFLGDSRLAPDLTEMAKPTAHESMGLHM